MTTYLDLRWSGSPAAISAALATLGHPEYADEGAAQDARVAAFGPAVLATVAGRAVMFALLRTTEEIAPPEGVYVEPGPVSEATTGVFMPGPVPASVAVWQAQVVMRRHGLLEAVEAAVDAAGEETQTWWRRGTDMGRHHPRTTDLAAALGVTGPQLDALFIEAAGVEP